MAITRLGLNFVQPVIEENESSGLMVSRTATQAEAEPRGNGATEWLCVEPEKQNDSMTSTILVSIIIITITISIIFNIFVQLDFILFHSIILLLYSTCRFLLSVSVLVSSPTSRWRLSDHVPLMNIHNLLPNLEHL